MILTFDIGNTKTTIGLYDCSSICCVKTFFVMSNEVYFDEVLAKVLLENVGAEQIDGAIIGSVVNGLDDVICRVLRKLYGVEPIILGSESMLPISIKVDVPKRLGVDRIINGSYSFCKYGQSIVVDCGSAITFDIVNTKAEFVGGIISLGLRNQLISIASSTSQLPKLEVSDIDEYIGKNTEDAIISGVVNGTAAMIDGMLQSCSKQLKGSSKFVLTGGDANFIAKYLKTEFVEVNSNFTLDGLCYLYCKNFY